MRAYRDIDIELIDPDAAQARRYFDPAKGDELAGSMAANGLAVPVLVRPVGDRFVLVHGERRWRAAKQLGWATIAAEVRDLTADEARWLALVENLQRADLTPIEEAEAYQAALAGGMLTQAALGARIGKSQSYIAQKLRLLTLPEPVAFYLARGLLTEGHARQLLRLRDIYTADFVSSTYPWEWFRDPDLPGLFDQPTCVALFFNAIRPEDQPVLLHGAVASDKEENKAAARHLTDACGVLTRYVREIDCRPPQWVMAAFWWASLAVLHSLSVARLQIAIANWEERFLSAVIFFAGGVCCTADGMNKAQQEADRERQYWGFHSDLRHAGVSEWIEGRFPDPVQQRALEKVLEAGSYVLPTNYRGDQADYVT